MPVSVTQEKIFTNYANKSMLIDYLIEGLRSIFFECYQEKGEADELFVEITVESFEFYKNYVAGDIDILVILFTRAEPDQEIYFLKLGKQKAANAVHSPKSSEEYSFCSLFYRM